jgi:hypothetical protein
MLNATSKPEWWCSLHSEALHRIGMGWVRPSDFTDRPEVVRDLARLGLIESKPVDKGRYTILFWRLSNAGSWSNFKNG